MEQRYLSIIFWCNCKCRKSIADQLCSMVGAFSDNMMKAFNPVLVKQEGSGNRKDMINLTFISCRFTYLMYSFIAIPFCLEMPFLLRLWLKNIPEWAVLFCQLQILRTLLEQMTIPIRTSLMARGCIKYMNLAVFMELFNIYNIVLDVFKW